MRESRRRKKIGIMKSEVKAYIDTLDMPFSVQDIAKEFGISWHSARAILLEMALEGELKAMKTTKGYIFFRRNNK